MTKEILIIALIAMLSISACNKRTKKVNQQTPKTETLISDSNNIIRQTLTDKNGNTLNLIFDNSKDILTIEIKGVTIELSRKIVASGIWYANDHYELRGKGNNIQLKKDGKLIFEHQDS